MVLTPSRVELKDRLSCTTFGVLTYTGIPGTGLEAIEHSVEAMEGCAESLSCTLRCK